MYKTFDSVCNLAVEWLMLMGLQGCGQRSFLFVLAGVNAVNSRRLGSVIGLGFG